MSEDLMMPMRTLPLNFGPLKGANGNARITGPCGDTMEFWVIIENKRIALAMYTTDGCEHSIICGAAAAALANGMPLSEIEKISQKDVLSIVENIPDESNHCALLAVTTLKAAVNNAIGSK